MSETANALNERSGLDKRALLARLLREKPNRLKYFPQSFGQQRLWLLHQLEPSSPLYHVITPVRLRGELDLNALRQAFVEIVRRHESLRTTFAEINGEPMQVVHPAKGFELQLVDLVALPADQREAEERRVVSESSQVPFDLNAGPLLRGTLLRLAENEHVLLLIMHHIVSDGWSMNVLAHEVGVLYHAFSQGRPSPLAELPIQYSDFSRWQRERLSGEVLKAHLNYWRERLSGELPLLELPTDRPRPAVRSLAGAACRIVWPKALSEQLRALSRGEGMTLFMTMLAAFQTLLYRYTGQPDIIVGTPIAGRDRIETEALIGFFVNTVMMRSDVSNNPSFREFLRRIKEVALGAQAHQELPFDRLVEELHVKRSSSHTPLFQVMFNLRAKTQSHESGKKKLEVRNWDALESALHTAKFDLTLTIIETGECITGSIEYSTDLFDEATIQRMISHFQNLLQAICANPETRLDDLTLLSDTERHQQLFAYNQTAYSDPAPDLCLQDLFETQVERTPDAIAVICDEEQISYGELNSRANQLAHHLQSLGVREESLVGIMVERSVEMLVGILAVLKAGAAYVPFDPSYPQQRLEFMLAETGVEVLLTQDRLVKRLASTLLNPRHSFATLCLDRDWERFAEHSTANPARRSVGANAAYVIYTSGSTGKPKGIVVPHAGALNLADAQRRALAVQPGTRVLQCASLSFDVSVWEILVSLMCGATLCLPKPETQMAGSALRELLQEQSIELVFLTPTVLATVASDGLPCLRTVVTGGEPCSTELAARWSAGRRLINAYGPTEITVFATLSDPLDGARQPPIGHPIANTQTYVLDKNMQPVAVGVAGELYVGGAGVTRGYLHRPELTAERFVPDPYSEQAGARLYRTGDLARRRADGELEYLGRLDEQVKIRGFRIELGEIEAVLGELAGVQEAVVLKQNGPTDPRLVAYLLPDTERGALLRFGSQLSEQQRDEGRSEGDQGERRLWFSEAEMIADVQQHLKEKLPSYMMPTAFVLVSEWPLTPNGKLDKRALPEVKEGRRGEEKSYVAPRTPVEETIAGIFSEVLSMECVGIFDNFFDLGGHSMLVMMVVSRLRRTFHVELPLRTVFESPTVVDLSLAIAQNIMEKKNRTDVAELLAEVQQFSGAPAQLLSQENLMHLTLAG